MSQDGQNKMHRFRGLEVRVSSQDFTYAFLKGQKSFNTKKGLGWSWGIFKRTPMRYQDPVRGRGLKLFSPPAGTNSKTTQYLLSYFLAQYPQYHKSSRCGPFEAQHNKRYQNFVFNP